MTRCTTNGHDEYTFDTYELGDIQSIDVVEDIGRVTLRGRYSHGRGQVRGEGVVVYELDVGGHSAMDKGDIRVGVYMGGVGLGSGQFWGGMGIMVIMIIRNRIWKREESLVNGVCRLTLDVSWGFVGLGGNSVEG
ncbi:hypothetical protein Tco_1053797 [Tanacetum coccineum]|uniref:Uncharacterized protein n=1 Tax=Tanacetum coccineum TaxID=301880 RepID=A0ABQ5GWI7_9ASTR